MSYYSGGHFNLQSGTRSVVVMIHYGVPIFCNRPVRTLHSIGRLVDRIRLQIRLETNLCEV